MNIHAYFCLMRLHKPVGFLLLWFPTAWALWLANQGNPPVPLIVYFLLGTILMRSAGCVINDIADRHIDKHIRRTATRPLTAGVIGLFPALLLLVGLLLLAFLILIRLPAACFYYALFSVFISFLYPFSKRFFEAPQLLLGIAFSMGIPMAYVASNHPFDRAMGLIFLINLIWIITYDTIYALADKEDDVRIGVKSTAIFFGTYVRFITQLLQFLLQLLWVLLALLLHFSFFFYVGWMLAGMVLVYQQRLFYSKRYLMAFSSHVWYGLIMWLALMTSTLV